MRQKFGGFALAAAFLLLFPALGPAQDNSVRIPVVPPAPEQPAPPPVRMEFKSKGKAGAQSNAQPGAQPGAQPNNTQDEEVRPSKFPNIDTAKNRQDYEISTPKADGIRLGRDEETGDTIMGTTPRKKKPQVDPYANTPIEVRPIIRGF
ncbi:MAG: hypothetical protein KKF77_09195 [Proteobacteria bacterium]|nr:hypothetical protein [Pseudomonadota bacterium]